MNYDDDGRQQRPLQPLPMINQFDPYTGFRFPIELRALHVSYLRSSDAVKKIVDYSIAPVDDVFGVFDVYAVVDVVAAGVADAAVAGVADAAVVAVEITLKNNEI